MRRISGLLLGILLLISLFSCASFAPLNQATVVNVFHLDANDPMMLTIETCVTGTSGVRPAPALFLIKEFIESPAIMGGGIAVAEYVPWTNIIYITLPLRTEVLEHELVHWANWQVPHESDLFWKCSHLY